MDTPKEYRQRAADCLKLADEAPEAYVKAALIEHAAELVQAADLIERGTRARCAGR
jgi:hypothetical protein